MWIPDYDIRYDISRTGAKAYPVFYLYGLKQEDKVSSACDTLMRPCKRYRRYINNVLYRFRRMIKSNRAHAPNGLKEVKVKWNKS